jgi:magnesium transporter
MKPVESLLRTFVELHPEDAARAVEALPPDDAARLFKNLPTRTALSLVERLQPHVAARLLQNAAPDKCHELLAETDVRTASVILQHLDEAFRPQVLASLPGSLSRALSELSIYPAETAGGMMQSKVAALSLDLTAQQAIAAIRKAPRDALYYLYVTQRDGTLAGVLSMRDLLLAAPRDPIEPLVRRDVLSVQDTMLREDVVHLMSERRFLALPVVDIQGKLLGVVKFDEALQAGKLEAFEDLQKIVGAGGDERALSPVGTVVQRRLPWLYVNLATAFLASAVVGLFESVIAQVTALAVLLPVVSGQGGNSGSQSLAVVMRGLALREIIPGAGRRVVRKEVLAALINGLAVAVITSLAVLLYWRETPALALVIGLAMVVNMTAAALSGTIIPLALRALGRDPAQSAAIFLTTVTDVIGFASFLGFAVLFMRWLV